jgi:hypothetical protein
VHYLLVRVLLLLARVLLLLAKECPVVADRKTEML